MGGEGGVAGGIAGMGAGQLEGPRRIKRGDMVEGMVIQGYRLFGRQY